MTFSLRTFLIVVAWCAIVIGAITAMLRLPSRSTDLPVGLLFALVVCSSAFAVIRAVFDRSSRRTFWTGYALVCVGCGLIANSEPLMLAHRGQLQCFAIGFLIPLCAYSGLHIVAGPAELDPYDGRLPTTRMLQPVYELVVRRRWVDAFTGQDLPDYQPAAVPARHQGGGLLPAGMSPVTRAESPSRTTFMILGHLMMAMALGYAGAKFAVLVRRHQDHTDPA